MKNRLLVIAMALAVALGMTFVAVTTGGGTVRGQGEVGLGCFDSEPSVLPRRRRPIPQPRRRLIPQPRRRLMPPRPTPTPTPIRHANAHADRDRDADKHANAHPDQDHDADTSNTVHANAPVTSIATPTRHADADSNPATPTPNPECLVPVPLDVVIIIDRSGSMDEPPPDNRIYWAKLAANNLIDELAGGDDNLSPHRVSVISFAGRQRSDPPPRARCRHQRLRRPLGGQLHHYRRLHLHRPGADSRHQPVGHPRPCRRHEGRHPAVRRQELDELRRDARTLPRAGPTPSTPYPPCTPPPTRSTRSASARRGRALGPRRAAASADRQTLRELHPCG